MWIDALSNYVTTNHGLCFHHVNHVFGKDILKFHGYYYPCLLMALSKCVDLCCFLDLPLPTKMICHNHWTINGTKISKSKGNFIPLRSIREYVAIRNDIEL